MDELIVVENLRLGVEEPDAVLPKRAAERLGVDAGAIEGLDVVHRSLDARRKRDIHWTLHVALRLSDARAREAALAKGLAKRPEPKVKEGLDALILGGVPHGQRPLPAPPVVVGSGPGGLFAAWLLAREGYRPIVVERGPAVDKRVRVVNAFDQGGPHDPECNILFGEGGAGTFSDGKLTTRGRTPLVGLVHDLLIAAKAPAEIKVVAKPHVGTDRLRAVLVYLRRELERLGTTFRFGARVDDLLLDAQGGVRAVRLQDGTELAAGAVVLAIGHSARDTYSWLRARGVQMEFKPFQLGLRIEHPQPLIDRAQYGEMAGKLPVAEYVLNDKHTGVFSFCMCPGGTIMASVSEAGYLCTNGMSRRKRDSGWANSGLVYTIGPELVPGRGADPLGGVEVQRRYEKRAFELGGGTYAIPAQRAPDFLRGKKSKGPLASSYPRELVGADLREVIPPDVGRAMQKALDFFERIVPGYGSDAGLLVGPEARGSSPVRIPRDDATRESPSTPRLYPVGEGAGYAGGIMSAAIDGLRTAAALVQAFAPAS
jgi:uncharacterized FAD-dependent dehydrogenase